jgi:thioredoxin-related protein
MFAAGSSWMLREGCVAFPPRQIKGSRTMSHWRVLERGSSAIRHVLIFAVLAGYVPLAAAEQPSVAWHHDVKHAWQSTQQQGRPLLVFVTTNHCMYCTKMKQGTYANAAVAATINRSFVPLVLDGEAPSPLLKDLAVKAFPATFIISPNAVILDRLDGYVAPDKLMARLAAIQALATAQTDHRD